MNSILSQNILIVDDEKSNIDILLKLLKTTNEDNRYNIIVALSGKKVLKIVQERDRHFSKIC